MFLSLVSIDTPSQRVQFILGTEDDDEEHIPHDLFTELDEICWREGEDALCPRKQPGLLPLVPSTHPSETLFLVPPDQGRGSRCRVGVRENPVCWLCDLGQVTSPFCPQFPYK